MPFDAMGEATLPFDAQGNYSLPQVYLAETGTTIEAVQHNTPLQDLQSALGSLMLRSGVTPFTGQLKGFAGTVSAPGISFNAAPSSGMFADGSHLGLASAGVKVGFVHIGQGTDFWGTTAPAGWLFPYGQAISRTTYAALFAVLGTTYGAGDGSTTFNMPDKRDRASFGKGNMGGTAANRITDQSGGWEGDTLGDTGGAQTDTMVIANLPSANLTVTIPSGQGGHSHGYNTFTSQSAMASGSDGVFLNSTGATTTTATLPAMSGTAATGGTSTPMNNLPPGIVCNYIIYAGA